MHSNASTTACRIEISGKLLEHHKGHEDEILAILAHEFGHWHYMHLFKNIIFDTVYMVLFGLFLTPLIENETLNADLMRSFGFQQKSYCISLILLVLIWLVSADLILNSLINNFIWRRHEYQADIFTVT